MSALPKWSSIRQQVLDDARYGTGEAHLESPEVPQWITETGDHDIIGTLAEALTDVEGKRHEQMASLLTLLCQNGDELSQRKCVELLDLLRATLTDHCIADAQRMVDNA